MIVQHRKMYQKQSQQTTPVPYMTSLVSVLSFLGFVVLFCVSDGSLSYKVACGLFLLLGAYMLSQSIKSYRGLVVVKPSGTSTSAPAGTLGGNVTADRGVTGVVGGGGQVGGMVGGPPAFSPTSYSYSASPFTSAYASPIGSYGTSLGFSPVASPSPLIKASPLTSQYGTRYEATTGGYLEMERSAFREETDLNQYPPFTNLSKSDFSPANRSNTMPLPVHPNEFSSPLPSFNLNRPGVSPFIPPAATSTTAFPSHRESYVPREMNAYMSGPEGMGMMTGMKDRDREKEREILSPFPSYSDNYGQFDSRGGGGGYSSLKPKVDKKPIIDDNYFQSSQLYSELNVQNKIDSWSDTMRRWFSSVLLKPLTKAIGELEKTVGRSLKSPTPLLYFPTSNNSPPFMWYNKDLVTACMKLERYLNIPNATREYLINRLYELADGDWIGKFSTNDSKGNVSDSKILLHLFCTYMDEQISEVDGQTKPFTSRHLAVTPQKPDKDLSSAIVIYQTSLNPPHLNLFVNGKDMWEIQPGRNNLFHALVLFIWFIKHKRNGCIQSITLSSAQLTEVVD